MCVSERGISVKFKVIQRCGNANSLVKKTVKSKYSSIFVTKILKYERPFIIEHLSGVCMIEHVS